MEQIFTQDLTLNGARWVRIKLLKNAENIKGKNYIFAQHYLSVNDVFFVLGRPSQKFYIAGMGKLLGSGVKQYEFKRLDGFPIVEADLQKLLNNKTIIRNGYLENSPLNCNICSV